MTDLTFVQWVEVVLTFFALVFVSILVHDLVAGHLHGVRSIAVLAGAVVVVGVGVTRQFRHWWHPYQITESDKRGTALLMWSMLIVAFVSGHVFATESLSMLRSIGGSVKIVLMSGASYVIAAQVARVLSRKFPQFTLDRRSRRGGGHA